DYAAEFVELTPFAQGSLVDALLAAVRARTQLAVQRNDFKLETLSPHLFMSLRVVDEHGRQLGMGRHLASLKAELGGEARSAFQALAKLKTTTAAAPAVERSAAPAASSHAATKAAPAPEAPAQR